MNFAHTEFHALVRDALLLLQQEGSQKPIVYPNASKNRHLGISNRKDVVASSIPKSKPQIAATARCKAKTPVYQKSEKPQTSSENSILNLLRKCAPHMRVLNPTTPIVLVSSSPTKETTLFLEKVASAITSFLIPAALCSSQQLPTLCQSPLLKMVIAPYPLLDSLFHLKSQGKIHQIVGKQKQILFFSLADLKSYHDNLELKRALWNKLKDLKSQIV